MKIHLVQIFDPAMCCSSGVCGPEVDPKVVQFAADLEWLKSQGVIVQRHNLSQNLQIFVEREVVRVALAEKGEGALPIILIDGEVVATGQYPQRKDLADLLELALAPTRPSGNSSCCGGGSCG